MQRPDLISLTVTVLRDPLSLLDSAEDPAAFSHIAPRLLAIAGVGGAIFGAVLGSYRGGIQVLYAALKLPILLVLPVLVVLPAVRAIYAAGGFQLAWSRLAMAGLAGMARTGVLAAAAGPALWLFYSLAPGYHLSVLVMAGALAVVGLPGMATVGRAIPARGLRRVLPAAFALGLLGLTVAQSGWLLRPFIARPTAEVAFLRPIEADVFSSLGTSVGSAAGVYGKWDARPAGLVGRRNAREE